MIKEENFNETEKKKKKTPKEINRAKESKKNE